MMNAIKIVNDLEDAGFTKLQAETSVSKWIEMMNENLASKKDLKDVVHKLELMETNLTIKLGKMIFTGFTVLGIILGILIKS